MGYLRLDARPTKQAIITWVSKWTYLYTSYLQSKVNILKPCLSNPHQMVANAAEIQAGMATEAETRC